MHVKYTVNLFYVNIYNNCIYWYNTGTIVFISIVVNKNV